MFDLSFTELLLIGVVALVVLGPERLPKVARMTGLWVRRARAQWYSVKAELERDLAAEELRRSMHDVQQGVQAMDQSMRDTHAGMQRDLHQIGYEVRHGNPSAEPVDGDGSDFDAAVAEHDIHADGQDAASPTRHGIASPNTPPAASQHSRPPAATDTDEPRHDRG